MTAPTMDRALARLVEKAFAERAALEAAALERRAAPHAGAQLRQALADTDPPDDQFGDGIADALALLKPAPWWPGDPLNCAGCALAIEQAREYCQGEDHACDPFCWDGVRCPNCREAGAA